MTKGEAERYIRVTSYLPPDALPKPVPPKPPLESPNPDPPNPPLDDELLRNAQLSVYL